MNMMFITKIFEPKKVLYDWIDINELIWSNLSINPNAVDMFYGNEDRICFRRVVHMKEAIKFIEQNLDCLTDHEWSELNMNPAAIEILKKNNHRINLYELSGNPNGIDIIQYFIDKSSLYSYKLDIYKLYTNPSAIDIINTHFTISGEDNINEFSIIGDIYLEMLLRNPRMMEINIIKNNLDYLLDLNIDISGLYENPNESLKHIMLQNVDKAVKQSNFEALSSCIYVKEIYIDILKIFDNEGNLIDFEKEHMVDWQCISKNKHAIKIIEKNLNKIEWRWLCTNENAIHIIENNQNKINWSLLSRNKGIFKDSYEPYMKYLDIIDIIFE